MNGFYTVRNQPEKHHRYREIDPATQNSAGSLIRFQRNPCLPCRLELSSSCFVRVVRKQCPWERRGHSRPRIQTSQTNQGRCRCHRFQACIIPRQLRASRHRRSFETGWQRSASGTQGSCSVLQLQTSIY